MLPIKCETTRFICKIEKKFVTLHPKLHIQKAFRKETEKTTYYGRDYG